MADDSRITVAETTDAAVAEALAAMTPLQRRDYAAAQPYKHDDVDQLHEKGTINLRPHGERILLRAIRRQDAYGFAQTQVDARDCNAHEVLAIGGGVAKWYDERGVPEADRIRVGQHVFVVSAATDRASKTDRSVRIWFARVEHVVGNWDPPAAS